MIATSLRFLFAEVAMNTREFLEAVWPTAGHYCIALPGKAKGYVHKVYETISDAVSFVKSRRDTDNIFFAVHTLKQEKVWNPEKKNWKTGEPGAFEWRTHANMKEARAFFFDLDVGESVGTSIKYPTREAALGSLQQFLFNTGLPDPLVTSSGGGFHVYWRITRALSSDKWRVTAARLHALAMHFGMLHDPMRTTDRSSVLRVAGTFNFKQNGQRPVLVLHEGEETDTREFIKLVRSLAEEHNITDADPVPARGAPEASRDAGALPDNIEKPAYDGPVTTLKEALTVCENLRNYCAAGGMVPEPQWYTMIGMMQHLKNGIKAIQKFSSKHPNYSWADTQAKLDQYNAKADGPPTCETINRKFGQASACATCPFFAHKINPLIAGKRQHLLTAAPPVAATSTGTVYTVPCEPPKQYVRSEKAISRVFIDEDGIKQTEKILAYNMFPIADHNRTQDNPAYSTWVVDQTHVGFVEIELNNTALTDNRTLTSELFNHGIYFDPKHAQHVRGFMSAYIKSLQDHQRATKQYDHLGWTDNRTKFVLPTVVLGTDGSEEPASLTGAADAARRYVLKGGTLAEQIKALEFFNRDEYLPLQAAILASLGSVILPFTEKGGVVVSLSGLKGSSKSTTLYAAAGLWGPPTHYTLNGTKNGSTANARADRGITLANLPLCIDEYTNPDPKEVQDFALGHSQFTDKVRLDKNSRQKEQRSEDKSSIAIVTTNNSLHQLMSINNAAGDASAARVFEIVLPQANPNHKAKADRMIRSLNLNFGHIGEAFVRSIITQLPTLVASLDAYTVSFDTKNNIEPGERFYSSGCAALMTAGVFAKAEGLIPFDLTKIQRWIVSKQLPSMRNVIMEEARSSDPAVVLGNYIASINGDIISVTMNRMTNGTPFSDAEKGPIRDMKGHIDTEASLGYFRKEAFRQWCNRYGYNAAQIISSLFAREIVTKREVKYTIGKGTTMAKVRSLCFEVNMAHSALIGRKPVPDDDTNVVALTTKKGLPKKAHSTEVLGKNV